MQLIGDILGDVNRLIKKRTEQLGAHDRARVPAENSIALKSVNSAREGTNSSVSENACRIAECERPAVPAPGAEDHRRGVCVYIREEATAQAARRSYRW